MKKLINKMKISIEKLILTEIVKKIEDHCDGFRKQYNGTNEISWKRKNKSTN